MFVCTEVLRKEFEENGYILIRGLYSQGEMEKINGALENNKSILEQSFTVADGEEGKSRLCLWNHPGDDLTGVVARCERMVGTCEKLLGGEVYHYHTKLMMKQPFTGGKHVWHQDYGYWYKNGCLFPDMLTAFIAVDACNKENGCLQILRGSHKAGRIEHLLVGGQTGADLERVNELKKVCDLEFVEMEPGDCLFFHCNLLHTSNKNESPNRRWAFLCAYNKATNNPVYDHHHPKYTPIAKLPDAALMECTNYTDMTGKDFLNPSIDKTVKT